MLKSDSKMLTDKEREKLDSLNRRVTDICDQMREVTNRVRCEPDFFPLACAIEALESARRVIYWAYKKAP